MNKTTKEQMKEAFEKIESMMEAAQKANELQEVAYEMMKDVDPATRASAMTILLSRFIMDENDDLHSALAFVARFSHSVIDVLDRHADEFEECEECAGEDDTIQ